MSRKRAVPEGSLPTYPRDLQHEKQGPEPGALMDEEVERGAAATVIKSRSIEQGQGL